MAVLPVIKGANAPILRAPAKHVPKLTKDVRAILKDMEATVHAEDGAGIAAPQVGIGLSMCLALIGGKLTTMINPEIRAKGKETEVAEEGCLSLPGITVAVPRAREIVVTYLDGRGSRQERRFTDMDARVVQHEVDHLNGVLIVDYAKRAGEEPNPVDMGALTSRSSSRMNPRTVPGSSE